MCRPGASTDHWLDLGLTGTGGQGFNAARPSHRPGGRRRALGTRLGMCEINRLRRCRPVRFGRKPASDGGHIHGWALGLWADTGSSIRCGLRAVCIPGALSDVVDKPMAEAP